MTEYSLLWATSTSGDGSDAYTSDETRKLWLAMFSNGVFKGYLNDLAVTGTASPIAVNSGAAVIQGHPYFNTASVSKTVTTPSTNTTGLRVVVRVDWLGRAASTTNPIYPATNQYEVRIVVITSPDGTAAIPDPITTDADTYDLTLATGTITTAGVIALTDARTYTKARREEIAAADIANRTRSFFMPAMWMRDCSGYDQATITTLNYSGYPYVRTCSIADSLFQAGAMFYTPADYASGLTVKALVQNGSFPANVYVETSARYGAPSENPMWVLVHSNQGASAAVTLSGMNAICSTSLTNLALGDIVSVYFSRDESNVLDTGGNVNIYFYGFLIEYTADS